MTIHTEDREEEFSTETTVSVNNTYGLPFVTPSLTPADIKQEFTDFVLTLMFQKVIAKDDFSDDFLLNKANLFVLLTPFVNGSKTVCLVTDPDGFMDGFPEQILEWLVLSNYDIPDELPKDTGVDVTDIVNMYNHNIPQALPMSSTLKQHLTEMGSEWSELATTYLQDQEAVLDTEPTGEVVDTDVSSFGNDVVDALDDMFDKATVEATTNYNKLESVMETHNSVSSSSSGTGTPLWMTALGVGAVVVAGYYGYKYLTDNESSEDVVVIDLDSCI